MKLKKNIQRVVIALTIIAIGSTGMPNIAYGAVAKTINKNTLKTVAKVVPSSFSTKFVNYTKVNRNFTFTGKISGIKAPQAIKVYIDKARVSTLSTDKYGNFTYVVPIKNYKVASHVIKFTAKLKNRKTISLSRTVKYTKFMTFGMDPIDPSIVYTEKVVLKGWALSIYGIKSVKVYVDKKYVDNARIGLPSEEIGKIYNYKNSANSGFQYDLVDLNKYEAGTHEIKVDILGNDRKLKTKTFKVIFGAKITVDKPVFDNAPTGRTLTLTGYAVHPSGVKDIQVLVDEVPQPNVIIGLQNSDAEKKYSKYPGYNIAGYKVVVDVSSWSLSQHDVKVILTGTDGDKITYVKDMGLDGVTYAFMDKTLKYYKDAENSRGKNTSYNNDEIKASYEELEMYMNTLNYVNNPQYKYVFMKLNYFDGITAAMLDKALVRKGKLAGRGKVFLEAGKANNINPIYLVSHALLETGNGSSKLSKGILVSNIQLTEIDKLTGKYTLVPVTSKPLLTVYNVFGVGAYDDDPNNFGASMAYTGGRSYTALTASEKIKALNGDYAWDTVDKAIKGGAKFIGLNYVNAPIKGNIKYQQNTLYKMKWNLFAMENRAFSTHQYATDVGWARKQTNRIKFLVNSMGNPEVQYEVPIFVE